MIATFTLLAAIAQSNNQDFSTIDSTVNTLYAVISGEAGKKRDWDKFKSLFIEGGMLRATVRSANGRRLVEMTPDKYIEQSGPVLEQRGFFEKEIFRKTEQFADIANVFSTYSSSATKDGEAFQRGINTIQMRYDGTRWWIVSLLWQGETADTPLPKQYLPGG